MRRHPHILVFALLGAVLVAGCGTAAPAATPIDSNALSTSIVGSLVASRFQTSTALAPLPSATQMPSSTALPTLVLPTPISPTATYWYIAPTVVTATPSSTGTVSTPTVDPNSLAYGCNNLAFIKDVTIPSGTVLKPQEDFTKTWKVANTGTCNWMYHYALVFLGGDALQGTTTPLNKLVTAGHWAEISIALSAPRDDGVYTGYWRLSDGAGHMFGASLAVSIRVSLSPTSTPLPPTDTETPTTGP